MPRRVVLLTIVLACLACFAGGTAPPSGLVQVAGGSVFLHCVGNGHPVVLLDSGAGNGYGQWRRIQPVVGRRTEVCSWDRPGVARSSAPAGTMSGEEIVARVHEALAGAGVQPPYIAAGHSLGGFFALLFAHRYRRDVIGLVLVDAAAPAVIRPFGFGVLRDGKHLVDIASASRALEGPAPDGTIVLVHGIDRFGGEHERRWRRAQAALAASPRSLPVTALRSGHDIPKQQPALVEAALLDSVAARRAGRRPRCVPALRRAAACRAKAPTRRRRPSGRAGSARASV